MTNIYLENTLLLKGDKETTLAEPIELEYYLAESENNFCNETCCDKTYGIGIIKKTRDICTEGILITDFSSCKTRTREVLKKLASNSVTPVALHYVLEDIVDN